MNFKRRLLWAALAAASACGVDKIQHIDDGMFERGHVTLDAGEVDGGADGGPVVSVPAETVWVDSGAVDSGTADGGPVETMDAGGVDSGTVDAGCTRGGVSPQLAELPGGPYQNCQGGQIPRTDYQEDTGPWSGCCGTLVRVCQVTGYSTGNPVYCQ